jgi:plasmid maintenance system antidote protein VapI
MKKVTQRSTAEKIGIKGYFLNHILNSRRPCPPPLALKLEKVTGIDRTVWVWGTKEEKRTAWEAFLQSRNVRCCASTKTTNLL